MTLIVQSERWCEMFLSGAEKSNCTQCHQAAVTVCEGCGTAVCDLHEIICSRCGRGYCSQCEHACVSGQPLQRAA